MVSDYVIMKIEHLKRKHDPDCGVGSWCDYGADRFNKEVDWIISEVRAANTMEGANLQHTTAQFCYKQCQVALEVIGDSKNTI